VDRLLVLGLGHTSLRPGTANGTSLVPIVNRAAAAVDFGLE
jgi:hypothetical protein